MRLNKVEIKTEIVIAHAIENGIQNFDSEQDKEEEIKRDLD